MRSLLLCCLLATVLATPYTVTPAQNWIATLQGLKAGDTLTFTAGTYTVTSKLSVSLAGTAAAPIVISGEDGAVIQRGNANQNIIDFGSGSYFTIQNLEFIGGSKGLRFGETGNVTNALLLGNKVHGTATTAITFNDVGKTYSNITLRSNEIYDTGKSESECLYMGCNQNACTASYCIIENNYCHDTLDATAGSYGSGLQVKTGSNNNILRNNVMVDTRGPGILIYDDYDQGANMVYGNFIWRSGDNGIQATAGARIFNNIISAASGSGIAVQGNQPQTGKSIRNVIIDHNTIIGNGNGIAIGSTTQGATFTLINNAIFSGNNPLSGVPTGATTAGNGISGGSDTATTVGLGTADEEFISTTVPDYYPASGSKMIAKGSAAALSLVANDFNMNPRANPPTIGAYEYSTATNPGWQLQQGFKSVTTPTSTTTTTTTTTATGTATTATTTAATTAATTATSTSGTRVGSSTSGVAPSSTASPSPSQSGELISSASQLSAVSFIISILVLFCQ